MAIESEKVLERNGRSSIVEFVKGFLNGWENPDRAKIIEYNAEKQEATENGSSRYVGVDGNKYIIVDDGYGRRAIPLERP